MMTAGVYIKFNNRFAFMVGPNKDHSVHGVVRFGGHAVGSETATECALREVKEEAGIEVELRDSPRTHYVADPDTDSVIVDPENTFAIRPILMSGGTAESPNSIMFLGYADELPTPCSETKGITLLSLEEIKTICETELTLMEFLNMGGQLIERDTLDRTLPLVPYFQLQFLHKLINAGEMESEGGK